MNNQKKLIDIASGVQEEIKHLRLEFGSSSERVTFEKITNIDKFTEKLQSIHSSFEQLGKIFSLLDNLYDFKPTMKAFLFLIIF